MNIDLAKLFPEGTAAKGISTLIVNYFDIIQLEACEKSGQGFNATTVKEHKLVMRDGIRHHFPAMNDNGIETLAAVRRAFNIIDTWNGMKDTLLPDIRNSMEPQYKEAQHFVMWAHQKFI